MSKPGDIPQDVIDAAADAYVAYCDERSRLTQAPTEDELLNVAARAIMAERERCATVAEQRGKELREMAIGSDIANTIREGH